MTTDTGYCTECHMIVDTAPDGTLKRHGSRGMVDNRGAWADCCSESGSPASPIPGTAEVEAARFAAEPRRAKCPRCDHPEAVQGGGGGRLFMRHHQAPGAVEGGPICPGSWELPEYES